MKNNGEVTPEKRADPRRATATTRIIDLHDDHEAIGAGLSRTMTPNERLQAVFTLSAHYLDFPEDDGARKRLRRSLTIVRR